MRNDEKNEVPQLVNGKNDNFDVSHRASEGKAIGILKALLLILVWVLSASYFWIFGLGGGRFVLSFVIGVPLVITILIVKDK